MELEIVPGGNSEVKPGQNHGERCCQEDEKGPGQQTRNRSALRCRVYDGGWALDRRRLQGYWPPNVKSASADNMVCAADENSANSAATERIPAICRFNARKRSEMRKPALRGFWFVPIFWIFGVLVVSLSSAQGQAAISGKEASRADFAPLEQWRDAVLQGGTVALRALYSDDPPVHVMTKAGRRDAAEEVAFWTGLKARRVKLDVQQSSEVQPGVRQITLEAEIRSAAGSEERTVYVSEMQVWQLQGERWRLAEVQRSNLARLQQPASMNKVIYPPNADAHAEIAEALQEAKNDHKRVLVVFGANWCFDCHVLDKAFHQPDFAPLLERSYIVVHVDIGRGEKNQDLARQYQVPLEKGIPALAVLASDGKLLVSQKNGEFENARALAPEDLLQFLNKWKM